MKQVILIICILSLILNGCSTPDTEADILPEDKEIIKTTDSNDNQLISNISESKETKIESEQIEDNNQTQTPEKQIEQNNWYRPRPKITWQWQLQGDIDTSYEVDLYDLDLFETSQPVIDELHDRGIKVICYISAGSWEEWRDDANDFPDSVIGKDYEGWPGEKWLDISNYEKFTEIMLSRLDLAKQKKCDGVEPDNIHGYQEDTGFELTYQDQIEYNIWLANEAHKRNLSIGLKNDGEQVKDLIDYYDFTVVEECFGWNECEPFKESIKQDKAVLGVEYNLEPSEFCKEANSLNFSWLKMNYELAGKRISCD